ncbi:MAG TPA: rhodanese-like domain-containing protein [Bacteroidales bacterium]
MNKKYVILAGLLILLGIGLVVLPSRQHPKEIEPGQLMSEIMSQSRYLSTDEVARKIIEKDPSYQYVDVRDAIQFSSFSLPGAINIPLNHLLDSANVLLLNQKVKDVVFFSNGDITAEKAWLLCRRMGYEHLYVMQGGLNRWAVTIMNPPVPLTTAPSQDFDTYEFRKGASAYFGGGTEAAPAQSKPTPQKVMVKPKSTSVPKAGGC